MQNILIQPPQGNSFRSQLMRAYRPGECGRISIVGAMALIALNLLNALQSFGQAQPIDSPSAAYEVLSRGPHHKVWRRVTQMIDDTGRSHWRTNAYTEIGTALHYSDTNGVWLESSPDFEISQDGAAVALRSQHHVRISQQLNDPNGAVDVKMPDGRHLRATVLGLQLFSPSTGISTQVSELRDCRAIQNAPNEITFADAFKGLRADVRMRNEVSAFHQEVILAEQITPDQLNRLGFTNTTDVRLEIWTEFFGSPQASVETNAASTVTGSSDSDSNGTAEDDSVDFGTMRLAEGKAFAEPIPGLQVPIRKQWFADQGRVCLVESAAYSELQPLLTNLPVSGIAVLERHEPKLLIAGRLLPQRSAHQQANQLEIAKYEPKPRNPTRPATPRVNLDFTILNNGGLTNYTFLGDTTYAITNTGTTVTLYGTTTFEGGTVIKMVTNASLSFLPTYFTPQLNFLSSTFHPVIFTSMSDDSVGERLPTSTHVPVVPSGTTSIMSLVGLGSQTISHARFAYGANGIAVSGSNPSILDSQFVSCGTALQLNGSATKLRNVLLANIITNFVMGSGTSIDAQQTTVANSICLVSGTSGPFGVSLPCTNCIFANVTNLTAGYATLSGDDNGFYNTSTFGSTTSSTTNNPFQVAGGAGFYLNGTAFRGSATSNIDPTLRADLKSLTTYPPTLLLPTAVSSNTWTFVTNNLTLYPQAQRDTNANDLGYHYGPLDYEVSLLYVTNATVSILPGTSIACFGTNVDNLVNVQNYQWYGIGLGPASSLTCQGTADKPVHLIEYPAIQESVISNSFAPFEYAGFLWGNFDARFIESSILAQDCQHILYSGHHSFQDSEFRGGALPAWYDYINLTNCLLERVITDIEPWNNSIPTIANCLLLGGSLWYDPTTSSGVIRDSLFDRTSIPDNSGDYGTYLGGYNAYVTTNYGCLLPTNSNDIILTSSPAYQTSWLGSYYLPTNSLLLNSGSMTADMAGLFHYTTQTNQVKEGTTTVDRGFHYVAVDAQGNPIDSDGDGIPDYLSDLNGNGILDFGEIPFAITIDNPVNNSVIH